MRIQTVWMRFQVLWNTSLGHHEVILKTPDICVWLTTHFLLENLWISELKTGDPSNVSHTFRTQKSTRSPLPNTHTHIQTHTYTHTHTHALLTWFCGCWGATRPCRGGIPGGAGTIRRHCPFPGTRPWNRPETNATTVSLHYSKRF